MSPVAAPLVGPVSVHEIVRIADDHLVRGQPVPLRSPLLGHDSQQPASAFHFNRDAGVHHRVEDVVEILPELGCTDGGHGDEDSPNDVRSASL